MNKISIAIHIVNFGDAGSTVYGDAKCLSKYTIDLRESNSDLMQLLSSDNPFLFMSLIKKSTILTIVKPIKGERANDYASAWIYVPAELDITGKQLKQIVENVKNILSDTRIDKEKINSLVNVEYSTRLALPYFKPSDQNGQDAMRYYGDAGYSLSEILDSPFQDVYSNYRRVFLIKVNSNIKYKSAEDITNKKILKIITIQPSKDTSGLGFQPYVNGELFEKPICAQEGTSLKVVWKKDGYENINKHFKVSDNVIVPFPIKNEVIRIINKDSIKAKVEVHDKNGGFISDFDIKSKYDDRGGNRLLVPDNEYETAKIKIEAFDYKPQEVPLSKAVNGIKVNLDEIKHNYTVVLDIHGFKYESKIQDSKRLSFGDLNLPNGFNCSTDGSLSEKEINCFYYVERKKSPDPGTTSSSKDKRISRNKILILAGFAVILILAYFFWSGNGNVKMQEKAQANTAEKDIPAIISENIAKPYLDSSDKWNKTIMQKMGPDFETLFEDMRTYNWGKIVGDCERLKNVNSERLDKLKDAAQKCNDKKVTPDDSTYHIVNDNIDFYEYKKKLEQFTNKVDVEETVSKNAVAPQHTTTSTRQKSNDGSSSGKEQNVKNTNDAGR